MRVRAEDPSLRRSKSRPCSPPPAPTAEPPTAMGFFLIRAARLLRLLLVLFLAAAATSPVAAQSRPPSPARILDAALQDYAYRAFARTRTGIVYNATLPGNLTGIAVSAVRLRSGSLRRKGLAGYFQFGVPTGVIGEGWEEVGHVGGSEAYEEYDSELGEMEEFWVKKAVAQGLVDDGNEQDVW